MAKKTRLEEDKKPQNGRIKQQSSRFFVIVSKLSMVFKNVPYLFLNLFFSDIMPKQQRKVPDARDGLVNKNQQKGEFQLGFLPIFNKKF